MKDVIIVGSGLAGIAFAELCLQNNQNILVVDKPIYNASRIAGGLYNPVILKRFTLAWKADEQLNFAKNFYKSLETKLQIKVDYPFHVHRIFHDVNEQNEWFLQSDKLSLSKFLNPCIIQNNNDHINAPYKLGEVLFSGFVDVVTLLENYHLYLKHLNCLLNTQFNYEDIFFHDDFLVYNGIKSKHIVFAEGFGLQDNPFFNILPLDGTKGDVLTLKIPNLSLEDKIIKKNKFLIPLGNDLYKLGATYDWDDKTDVPSEQAKTELIAGLKELTDLPFVIIAHESGVRPTVKDRKPLIGSHPKFKNLHVLNGMGTRGVILAPSMANNLWHHIFNNAPLDKEANIARFKKIIW